MCYTYKDIADIRGVTVYAIRQAVRRGILEPSDLKSVCKYIGRKENGNK